MGQWINFTEVRQRISLEDVMFRFYNLKNLKRDGDKVTGPCPVHGGDSPRAFAAQLERNVWHCFTQCQGGGNQLDFVAKKEGISIREAALKLQAHFVNDAVPSVKQTVTSASTETAPASPPQTPSAKPAAETEESGNKPLDLKLDVKGDHPHLVEVRQLAPQTIAHFGVGYCSRGIMKGTIAIPVRDEDGELVAYAGRRLKPSDIEEFGKYKLPKGFKKDLVLFNLDRAKQQTTDHLILVEGFFSVLKLHELGVVNVVAAMGNAVSDAQAKLLSDHTKDVVIMFDGDAAGRAGSEAAKTILEARGVSTHVIWLPDDAKPDTMPPRTLKWALRGSRALDLAELRFMLRQKSEK